MLTLWGLLCIFIYMHRNPKRKRKMWPFSPIVYIYIQAKIHFNCQYCKNLKFFKGFKHVIMYSWLLFIYFFILRCFLNYHFRVILIQKANLIFPTGFCGMFIFKWGVPSNFQNKKMPKMTTLSTETCIYKFKIDYFSI